MEFMEPRRLMAVTLTDGVLEIVGTESADNLRIGYMMSADSTELGYIIAHVRVELNGQKYQFDGGDVNEIRAAMLGDNDSVNCQGNIGYIGPYKRFLQDGRPVWTEFEKPPVRIDLGDGNDTVQGSAAPETLRGGAGNDVLNGGDGRDVLRGGSGNDLLRGEGGIDRIFGEAGRDTLCGGFGADVIDYSDKHDSILTAVMDGRDRKLFA